MKVVAIDGPAGSGKSTVARGVAAALGLPTLDTGAMYHAIALAALEAEVDLDDPAAVAAVARAADVAVEAGVTTLDGRDVSTEIRGPRVTGAVSRVSGHPPVRAVLVERQRAWVHQHGGGVVEGRDIGTVVLPDAPLKVFITARDEVRAARRQRDETAAQRAVEVGAVRDALDRRDRADGTLGRATRPEDAAADAVVVDTSDVTAEEVIADLVARARHGSSGRPMTFYQFARGVVLAVFRVVFRVRVVGKARVPTTGAYILAPSHRSILDVPFAAYVTSRTVRFLAKDDLFDSALGRRLFDALGAVEVERGTADRGAIARPRRRAAAGGAGRDLPRGHASRGSRDRAAVRGGRVPEREVRRADRAGGHRGQRAHPAEGEGPPTRPPRGSVGGGAPPPTGARGPGAPQCGEGAHRAAADVVAALLRRRRAPGSVAARPPGATLARSLVVGSRGEARPMPDADTKIAIIGAGISGLATSYHLGHRDCAIFETTDHYAGHVHSEVRDGFTWDDGPHISFTTNEYVRSLFAELVDGAYEECPIRPSNYYQGHWIEHPAQTHLYQVPEPLRSECLASFLNTRTDDREPRNYQDWLDQSMGPVFAQNFPAAYTRKYWTTEPANLDTDWIGVRVLKPDVDDVVAGAEGPLGRSTYYVAGRDARYPSRGGFMAYTHRMAEGADIRYRTRLERIDFDKRRMGFASGAEIGYERVISTMPLPALIAAAVDAPDSVRDAAALLRCTNFLRVDVAAWHPTRRDELWMYVYDEDKLSVRISITENFSPHNAPPNKTGIQVEVYGSEYRPVPTDHDDVKVARRRRARRDGPPRWP